MSNATRTQNMLFAALLLLYTCLAAGYSALVPLGEGPDEPGHAAYVFFLGRAGRLPVQRADIRQSDVPGEGHQPPLAYVLALPATLWLPPTEREIDLPANQRFTWSGGEEVNAVGHGSREFWPWHGQVLAWHLARLVSVALGAVTVLCTYLAVQAASRHWQIADGGWPLLAAALLAFNPQFLFVSGLVTNDALLIALSAALLWLLVDGRSRPVALWQERTRLLVIGVVLGLALITKQSALLLVPVALIGSIRRGGWRDWRSLLAALVPGMLVLASAALVSGWWYMRNWRLYGDPLGLTAFRAEFATQPFDARSPLAWLNAFGQLHDSFWARFGWMNVAPPSWVIALFTMIELLALLGLVRLVRHGVHQALNDGRRGMGAWIGALAAQAGPCWNGIWILLPLLALAWVISFALTAGLVAWQGRLLFPALPALMILMAAGLQSVALGVLREALKRRVLLAVLVVALVLLALWLPFGVIVPAYPRYTLPEQLALTQLGTPVYARFARDRQERGVELRGWRIATDPRPGMPLDLRLMWHALGPQSRDWVVFIHLVDQQQEIVAWSDQDPLKGAFPMTQWVAGDWVADAHTLDLPADLAPGNYTLRVGLFDPHGKGRRMGHFDEQDELRGDSIDLGQIFIGP